MRSSADRRDGIDGAPGARQKNIEHRQRTVELRLLEIDLHVFRDEEAKAQHRIERLAQVGQRGGQDGARDFVDIRHGTDWFDAAKNVGARVGEKGVGVKKIRAAEHVKHRLAILVRWAEERRSPRPDLGELLFFQSLPRTIELGRVGGPPRIGAVHFERRASHRQSGQELRGRIGDRIGGQRRRAQSEGEKEQKPFQEGERQ